MGSRCSLDGSQHPAGGGKAARRWRNDSALQICKARPADDERYFKHKLGGLGQYYLGPLKDLEVLDGGAKEGVRYTAEWGRGFTADGATYASWFAKQFRRALGTGGRTARFSKLIESRRRVLPGFEDSQAPEHEVQVADSLLVAQNESDVEEVVARSLQLLLSLVARGSEESPYGDLVEGDRFFQTYEINLFSLERLTRDTWSAQTGAEWLEWLAAEWGLRVHFRVALRKLRYQSQDSFRIVPMEDTPMNTRPCYSTCAKTLSARQDRKMK